MQTTKAQTSMRIRAVSLVNTFVIRCQDSIIPLVSMSEIPSLYLASVVAQARLSLPWSHRKQVFSGRGSIEPAHEIMVLVT